MKSEEVQVSAAAVAEFDPKAPAETHKLNAFNYLLRAADTGESQ